MIVEGQQVASGLACDEPGDARVYDYPGQGRPPVGGQAGELGAGYRDHPGRGDRQHRAWHGRQAGDRRFDPAGEGAVRLRIPGSALDPPAERLVQRRLQRAAGRWRGGRGERVARDVPAQDPEGVVLVQPDIGAQVAQRAAQLGQDRAGGLLLARQATAPDLADAQVGAGQPGPGRPGLPVASSESWS
jgi:hypothetical protein